MTASYVVNSDFEEYAQPWTTDDPNQLNRLLEDAEHYVDMMASTRPVVLPATDTVMKLSVSGNPTGGTLSLTVAGISTAVISYNATYSQISSALNSAVGFSGYALVTGGPLPYAPIYVGLSGSLGGLSVPVGSVSASFLGDASAQASFVVTAPGGGVGKRFNLSQMMPSDIVAIKKAVCAQADYMNRVGDKVFKEAQYKTVSGPDFKTTGTLPYVAPKARQELGLASMAMGLTRAR